MKFTNGFWLVKDEITPNYAVEYDSHVVSGDALTVFANTKKVAGRGDCMNIPLLTIRLESPREDVIRVELVHWDGSEPEPLRAQVYEQAHEVQITETDDQIIYTSGKLSAVICTKPASWRIDYIYDGKLLTSTGYRNMACMQNRETGRTYMVEQLSIDIAENIYGLGERYTPFVKNGQNVQIWNEDGGTASEQTYKNIPFYLSNKGYGVLVDTFGDLEFEIASEKVENVQFSVLGERLAYYVVGGSDPKQAVSNYCALTGKPALAPAWSFGLWLTTSFTTNYDEETTSSFIDGMKERGIPLHVFHFDCYWMRRWHWCDFVWDPDTFPDPKGMLQRYHDKGLKICVWINPYIAQQSYLYEEGKKAGYLLKRDNGCIWQTDLWQPGMALVDFTNPAARAWYAGKLEALLDVGVDCFKTDFGERIPVRGVKWYDGTAPVDMHNYYTFLYNRTVFELLEKKRGKGEAVLFARSATTGSQQFPAHWGGDCSASYASMAETLRGGLSLACDGFGYWSHDISGFESTATPDIYKRWCQFGLLSSHSRLHGSSSYRVPWLFDDESCVVLKEMVELKCSLMPYLYGQAVTAHEDGIPMLRPMFMEFPGDRSAAPLDLQYMLGESLLVAPIFNDQGNADYYLPEGEWVNLFTRKICSGAGWKKEQYDYHSMPLMVRPNTILPVGACTDRPDYAYDRGVHLMLSQFTDQGRAFVRIPDVKGNIVMTASAVRDGNTITVTADGGSDWTVEMLAADAQPVSVIRDGNKAVVTLK